jgi:Na+/melibiose symporter-like transporter
MADHSEKLSFWTKAAYGIGDLGNSVGPLLFGLVIFPMFPARDPNAFRTIGLICGVSFILPNWITFWGTRERPEFQKEAALPLRKSLGFVLRNYAFRYTLSIRILSWMPVVIAQAVFAYYLIGSCSTSTGVGVERAEARHFGFARCVVGSFTRRRVVLSHHAQALRRDQARARAAVTVQLRQVVPNALKRVRGL